MALPVIGRAKALWDFQAGAPTDLALRAGQIVNITRKVDANWWEGEVDGKIGIFPVQYVQELPQEASPALPARPPAAGKSSFYNAPLSHAAQPAQASGPSCVTCNQPIASDVLRWQGAAYHPAKCLCCKRCDVQLGHDSVIKKVGTEPHCQACFNELMFGPPKTQPAAATPTPSSARPLPVPRPQPTPPVAAASASNVATTHAASSYVAARSAPPVPAVISPPAPALVEPTPPPVPARKGSNINHRPAPLPPGGLLPTPAAAPVEQPQYNAAPLVPHRPAPPPPGPAAAESTPPPVPYASRPTYNADQPPSAPYNTRPSYNGALAAAASSYPSSPPAAPHTQNGILMAHPTGVIAHPNKPAPISPRGQEPQATPAYQPALKPGEAYIPPPPPPVVPVIIPPLNPYSTNKKIKAVFVGDPGVGKTAFLHAAISGVFYQAYAPSQEGGLFNVVVFTDAGKTAVDLELYDTPGDFYTNPGYRHGLLGIADVIIVMFDQLNRSSFENAEKLWYAEIRDKYFTLKPLIIIATKQDLVKSQTRYDPNFVRHQECLDFAQRVDAAKFFDTSAQKNVMLRETLEKIAKLGLAPLSVVKGNKRVERVQTEKKKEGKRGVFGSLVDHYKYGM